METLILHPQTREQLAALKAIAKALKVPFEKKETKVISEREKSIDLYGLETVENVERAEKSIADGNFKVYDTSKTLGDNIEVWENTVQLSNSLHKNKLAYITKVAIVQP